MKKDKIDKKLLTNEQEFVVKQMIMTSFYDAFTENGKSIPPVDLDLELKRVSNVIASTIVYNVQQALLQHTVFDAAAESMSKKVKTKVKKKKVTKK